MLATRWQTRGFLPFSFCFCRQERELSFLNLKIFGPWVFGSASSWAVRVTLRSCDPHFTISSHANPLALEVEAVHIVISKFFLCFYEFLLIISINYSRENGRSVSRDQVLSLRLVIRQAGRSRQRAFGFLMNRLSLIDLQSGSPEFKFAFGSSHLDGKWWQQMRR